MRKIPKDFMGYVKVAKRKILVQQNMICMQMQVDIDTVKNKSHKAFFLWLKKSVFCGIICLNYGGIEHGKL